MRPIADAVVEAGLIDQDILNELAKWGVHITAVPQENILRTIEDVVEHICQSYEGEDQVRMDETDLDILHLYLSKGNQKQGRLILRDGKKHSTLNITFCLTRLGEYVIPWTDSDTAEILANGETHLKWTNGDLTFDVTFVSVRELFFGSTKAFVVCTPVTKEESNEGSS